MTHYLKIGKIYNLVYLLKCVNTIAYLY